MESELQKNKLVLQNLKSYSSELGEIDNCLDKKNKRNIINLNFLNELLEGATASYFLIISNLTKVLE